MAAFACQALKAIASAFQFGNADVERLDSGLSQLACARPVLSGIELEQLPDFLESEAGGLRLANEAETPDILASVAPDAALARRLIQQALALIETDRLDADSAARRKLSDGEGSDPVILYHSTGCKSEPAGAQGVSSSTHVGAWSLVFSQPRGVRSTPPAFSALASGGLSRK